MAFSSTAIANEFIRRAKKDGRRLSQMQLQKLVYIAHGFSLTVLNEPLTKDLIQAWEYGPVYPDLYFLVRKYGTEPLKGVIKSGDWDPYARDRGDEIRADGLEGDQVKLLDEVWRVYGRFEAFQLSALTHKPGTPWSEIYRDGDGRNAIIDDIKIQDHFNDLIEGSSGQAA